MEGKEGKVITRRKKLKSSSLQDTKTFVTWWNMVKEKPALISKARDSLGIWALQDEHFQEESWEAITGLALKIRPEEANISLSTHQPWLLPGLSGLLQALYSVGCKCSAQWQREWHLKAQGITMGMAILLEYSKPSTVVLELSDYADSSSFEALPRFVSTLSVSSCSVNLLLEGDFACKDGILTSDCLILPFLEPESRVRIGRLSCYLGAEAAGKFYHEGKLAESSEEDFPSARRPPVNPTLPVVRYLEVLKVKVSSTEVINLLNDCLPYLELLQDLDVHLALRGMVPSDDVPQISYTKDRLTLRLDYITDGKAKWAGEVTAALSRQYMDVWLCCCHMSSEGGMVFLDQLREHRTLVNSIHVFSSNSCRPNSSQFLSLSVAAGSLKSSTVLYW